MRVCDWLSACGLAPSLSHSDFSNNPLFGTIPTNIGQLTALLFLYMLSRSRITVLTASYAQVFAQQSNVWNHSFRNWTNEVALCLVSGAAGLKVVRSKKSLPQIPVREQLDRTNSVVNWSINGISFCVRCRLLRRRTFPAQRSSDTRRFLHTNSLTGSIPVTIGRLTKLEELYVWTIGGAV